jgi:hypothetical protein
MAMNLGQRMTCFSLRSSVLLFFAVFLIVQRVKGLREPLKNSAQPNTLNSSQGQTAGKVRFSSTDVIIKTYRRSARLKRVVHY